MYAIHRHDGSASWAADIGPLPVAGGQARTWFSRGGDSFKGDFQREAAKPAVVSGNAVQQLRALSALRTMRRFSVTASRPSFELAEKFLALITDRAPSMHVYAQMFSEGTAVLNFQINDASAQFEFLSCGTIAANIDRNGGEWDSDVPGFTGKQLPAEIVAQLGL